MDQKYRDHLFDRNLSNSSVANYSYAIKNFHKMQGQDIKFPHLRRANEIPYFFTGSETNKIAPFLTLCSTLEENTQIQ